MVSRETSHDRNLPGEWEPARAGLARYSDLLASVGVERGLIGPREAPRLWERHLLNSAVVVELVPLNAAVVDVGSGAGLPGIPMALVRPDVRMTLLEPLLRRSEFLREAVQVLDIADRVQVVRARAEEHREQYDVVTARAVAPLTRLAGWCLPLVAPHGQLLALKGSSAAAEVAESGLDAELIACGDGLIDPPTTVVRLRRGA